MGVCALSSAALAAVAAVLADALDAPGLVEASAALAAKGWGVLMGADFACKRAQPRRCGAGRSESKVWGPPPERSGWVGCRICFDAALQDV